MSSPVVEGRGLVKRFGDVVAVDGLDLAIHAGECFGMLGPNGAGKTTTVEMLQGLQTADAGEIAVLGQRWGHDERALRQRIGTQLQETELPDKLSVLEVLTLFRSFYHAGRTPEEVVGLVGLEEKRGAWVKHLSGGQRQRLAVACALVSNPEVLFLDEPTTGLDPQSRRTLWDIIDAFLADGGTVVLTTHYMDEAHRLCDRVGIVDHGRLIADGAPDALIASLGADHIVEFGVSDGTPPDVERLRTLPGVRDVRARDGRLQLTVAQPHETLPLLMQRLEADRVALTELVTHHATLEDVFIALTGRALRDG